MAAADDDDAEKGTRQRSSTVSCFGACFVDGKMKKWEESAGSQSRKKKKGGLLSWWRLIRRSKTMFGWKSQKTVPVDAAVVDVEEMEEVNMGEEVLVSAEKEKKGGAVGGTAAENGGGERATKVPKSKQVKPPNEPQKPADGPSTSKYATCRHSTSFNPRKPFAKPASPARSVSFPASGRRKLQRGQSSRKSGDLDLVVGMSILIIALAVLVWGRVCAVFCTSTWVYFISRLRKEARSGSRPDLGGPDMVSVEYNKKVVMEGLVERSRWNPAEIL